jgi:hypothetical protein
MFCKSGIHFCDKDMLKALIWREFLVVRLEQPNGKRAGPVEAEVKREGMCLNVSPSGADSFHS